MLIPRATPADRGSMSSVLSDLVGRLILLARCHEGQTMAEYGMLIGVITLVVVAAAVILGGDITGVFGSTAARV